jgi:hypothetical protein
MGNWLKGAACWLLVLISGSVTAQTNPTDGNLEEQFRRRVHTIESFINRFNNDEDNRGNSIRSAENGSATEAFLQERNRSIRGLFNAQSLADPKSKQKQLLENFLSDVNAPAKQRKLNFYDQGWYAEVKMEALYKQKPQQLTLILQIEETHPNVSKWVIRGATANFLNLTPDRPDSTQIIPPNSHGTDFISVPGNLANANAIAHFVAKEVQADQLSVFLYAVYNRELVLKQATHVTFHFLQLDGWIVRVKEFNRDGENAGWLVDELIPANDMAKRLYTAQKLNIR